MTPEDTIIFSTPGSGGFDEVPGAQVGPYKLISPLGEGGFGSVWLAERRHPFVQRVALKLVKAGMDSKAVVARFDQERQALAVMNHPGIAKVFDGGLTAQGRPYFAMEYVKGEPITEFCDRVKLSIDERLKLFEQACEAVQHAHLKGIVHRDLKPGNVLAFMVEGEGAKLKVIDFGVAKAMSQRMTEHTIFTETGQMIGTPEYMSPEQADPTGGDIDTRSDIYSLGVLLYELLVGATPFDAKELRKKAYGEIQRTIREQDPPSPSARLSTISTKDREAVSRIESARKLRAADLVRRLRGELEWIPQKAMRKEPQHRYQTAIALAEDVRNYLQGKPIAAAPESSAYRMRKYVRRNRGLVIGVGAVMTALVVGLGVATWQWRVAEAARDVAINQEAAADAARKDALSERNAAESARVAADGARAAADLDRLKAESELVRSNNFLTAITINSALKASQLGQYEQLRNDLATLEGLGQRNRFDVCLAVAESDKSVGELIWGQEDRRPRYVSSITFSPDGKTLASGGSSFRLWDATTGRALGEPLRIDDGGNSHSVKSVAFSPDGKTLASGGEDGTVRLWDAATGRAFDEPVLRRNKGDGYRGVNGVAFSPDGKTIAWIDGDLIRLWDTVTGKTLGEPLRGHDDRATSLAFSPDGKTLASGSWDETIRLWDVATGRTVGELLRGHESRRRSGVTSVAFSPDGTTLASGSNDATVRLWDVATREALGDLLRGHQGAVESVAFRPDGTTLASGSSDNTIRLWDATTGQALGEPLRGHAGDVKSVAFSPDGNTLASGGGDSVRLWDTTTRRAMGEPLSGNWAAVTSVAFSPDGKTLASGSDDDTIRLWDTATGRALGELLCGHTEGVNSVAFSPEGNTLASGSNDDTIRLWNTATGRALGEPLRGHEDNVTSVAFSPDGKTLASGSSDHTIRLWDTATDRALGEPLRGHEDNVTSVAFSPDGKTLASGSWDDTIRLWDTATGRALGEPLRSHRQVQSVAFSPDGTMLASGGSWDNTIRLWNIATGQPLGEPLRGQNSAVTSVAFCPDGKTLASAGKDIRLWDVATGRVLGDPLCGEYEISPYYSISANSVAFSPDGKLLASGGGDTTIHLWDAVPLRDRIGHIRARLAMVDEVRVMLTSQLPTLGTDRAAVTKLQESVLADPRFTGDLRKAALIVVGEVDFARQYETERLVWECEEAYDQKKKDWPLVLQRLAQFAPEDIVWRDYPAFWNEVVWAGLTELPHDSPARDLKMLLKYAERAVKILRREQGDSPLDGGTLSEIGNALATVARTHWELGDKGKALEVQREAVTVSAAALETISDEQAKAMHAEIKATLKLYESLPAGAALPTAAAPDTPAPTPIP